MEDRADDYYKNREHPERNEITVGQCNDARHYQSGERYYPVFGNVSTRIRSVGKSRNNVENTVYRKRYNDPEFNISIQGLADIICHVILDGNADLKHQTHNGHHEKDLLKFKPYSSFEIPHRGIVSRLGVHAKTPLRFRRRAAFLSASVIRVCIRIR